MQKDLEKLSALIDTLRGVPVKRSTRYAKIQEALISVAVFAQRDRNTDPAIRLLAAIGTGVYRAGVSKWLTLNAPIHFVDGEPKLSSDRQKEKECEVGYSIAQYESDLRASAPWFEIGKKSSAQNAWDTQKQLTELQSHLDRAVSRFMRHDPEVGQMIEKVAVYFRLEMSRGGYD